MTLPFTGTGGMFTRLGTLGGVISDTNAYRGATLTTDLNAVLAQYIASMTQEQLIDGIGAQLTTANQAASGLLSFLQQVAGNTVNEMVFADNPLITNNSVQASMGEVIRQMKANSQTVKKMTVGITNTPYSGNTGNGVLVSTSYRGDGLTQELQFPEAIQTVCVADSTTGTPLGNERFSVSGEVAETNVFATDWPLGSGAQTSITAINTTQGTILNNGGFETWTASVPNNFAVLVGASQISKATSPVYAGSASLKMAGDSSTLTSIAQTFSSSSGTTSRIGNQTLYAFNLWIRVDNVPAAGVLQVDFVDGSNADVLDQQGNSSAVTKTLSSLTANTWTAVNGVLRTPYVLPTTVKLRVRLSTALSTGTNLYIDNLALAGTTQLYSYGPSFAIFSGNSPFYVPDGFSSAATNSFGSGGTLNTFQILTGRLFTMGQYGYLLPSTSGTPTILDSLI